MRHQRAHTPDNAEISGRQQAASSMSYKYTIAQSLHINKSALISMMSKALHRIKAVMCFAAKPNRLGNRRAAEARLMTAHVEISPSSMTHYFVAL